MKKTLIGLSMLVAAGTASALDVGVSYNRNVSDDLNGYRLEVRQQWNKVSLSAGAERLDLARGNQDQVSLIAGYQLFKVMNVAVEAQAGAAYISADRAKDGLTSVVGLGASVPLIKNVALTTDVRRTIGQGDMKVHDATTAGVGIRYRF